MILLLGASLVWSALVGWLIFRAVTQYGAYRQLDVAGLHNGDDLPPVTVIVPARNEADDILRCLRSLLQQNYPPALLQIVMIDDGSTDGTAQIAMDLAKADDRLRVIESAPLPPGWQGKSFACWQGAQASGESRWICFMDADVQAAPSVLRSAVSTAQRDGIDMLSLEPFQRLIGFWERLIIPCGFLLLAFSQDLRKVNDPSTPDASANGQFILIRREKYLAVGGHAAVRSDIAEDSALARRVKRSGSRVLVMGAESMLSTRMYDGLASLWEGIAKNLVEMVGGMKNAVFFSAAAMVLPLCAIGLPLLAWIVLLHGPINWIGIFAVISATVGSLSILGVHIGTAVHLRVPFWYGFLFPLGYLMGSILAIDSVRRRLCGKVGWKGRTYQQTNTEKSPAPAPVPAHTGAGSTR